MSGALEPLFPGVVFEHAVSLGADCEVAHQLRRAGRLSVRGLFDWLVTPLSSIPEILADGGARLGRSFVCANEGASVRCGAYDVLYHHEFARVDGGLVSFSAEAVERCRAKMAHKFQSFLAGCAVSGPILFIRSGPETDLAWDEHGARKESVRPRDLNALTRAIEWRLPELQFRLLVVGISGGAEIVDEDRLDPRIVVQRLKRRSDQGWKLSDGDWDSFLARLSFASPAAPPSEPLEEALFWSGEDEGRTAAKEPALPVQVLQALVDEGRDLWRADDAFQAARVLTKAYDAGLREPRFLRGYLDLLTGEARYPEVLQKLKELEAEGFALGFRVLLTRAHAKLAVQRDRTVEIALAAGREAGETWLAPQALLGRLERACHGGEPFSFVRLGDGEARFLISIHPHLGPDLTSEEARALGEVVWSNWFGGSLASQADADVADLLASYHAAVENADILGVTDAKRMSGDPAHYGYLSAQEHWLRTHGGRGSERRWLTSALNHHELERLTPHLSRLLDGLSFLGVLSPHPDLAGRLAARFAIPLHIGYVIPAEGRLAVAEATRRYGRHFPDRYLKIIDSLTVPFPGAVFLVAAGLLGKVYCDRIKQLGGVALDIGSLADAWMGFDTRNGQLADVGALPTQAPATRETAGCVSFGKTGSMALAVAIRDAGYVDAVHLHYLGPRARAIRRTDPEPMLNLADEVSRRLDDPSHTFRLVTSVRDPVTRILSQAFYRAEQTGSDAAIEAIQSPEALLSWWSKTPTAKRDVWADWFDDTFKATFGFDFRDHVFDHGRRSLRFRSDRLTLLVLRQDDDVSFKIPELRWLLERQDVALKPVNQTGRLEDGADYSNFTANFTAPTPWLAEVYNDAVVRHFYTADERQSLIRRWSRDRESR